MEDEINLDLRKYVDWVFKWAWLIALCMVIVGGVAFGVGWQQQSRERPYEAKATLVLLKSRTEVTLGSAIKTLSDDTLTMKAGSSIDTMQAVGSALSNIDAARTYRRINSLLGMVTSAEVAEQVAADLKGVLGDNERKPAALAASVRAEAYLPEGSTAAKGTLASDSILIIASHSDPEKAALVANAWARRYEAYVNRLFGGSALAPFGDINAQVNEARARYDTTQETLIKYLSEENRDNELKRQIAEEEVIIARLRAGRQTSVSAIVDKQVTVTQQLINAYLENDTSNRLLAFNKGQESKRQILGAWVDAEAANRLAAIKRDRDIRLSTFTATVQSEIAGRRQVLEQQSKDILNRLNTAYARKQALEGLLLEARLMQDQLTRGGEASARSTALSLFALKNRVFATTSGLPAFDKLDIQTASLDDLVQRRSAAEQLADLNGLTAAMQAEVAALDKSIQEQSRTILGGGGYSSLEQILPQYLSISPTLTSTLGLNGTAALDLNSFIAQQYADLFKVGTLAQGAEKMATNTPLFAEIKALYPELFTKDAMMDLATATGDKTELSNMANRMAEDLLNMKGWEGVTSYAIESKPLSQEIVQRENHVRLLQADVARMNQMKVYLQQARDLSWQAYSTLLSKQLEVMIASATEGTEVKVAALAVIPTGRPPVKGVSPALPGIALGLLLGLIVAFVLEYQGIALTPRDLWAQAGLVWSRFYRPGAKVAKSDE